MVAIGRDVVVLSALGTARRLRGDTGDTVQTYAVAGAFPERRSLAADGRTVAIGDPFHGEHGGVHLFDAVTGALRETVETTEPASEALGWETALDGSRLVTMSHPFPGDATLFGFRP
jgi:hypothetical protein